MQGAEVLNVFFDLWLKPFLVLIFILYFSKWNVARSPQLCHWRILTLTFLSLAFIPASLFLPSIGIDIYPMSALGSRWLNPDWFELALAKQVSYVVAVFYFFIALVLLGKHQYEFFLANSMVARSEKLKLSQLRCAHCIELVRSVDVRVSSELHTPVTWGYVKPVIILPEKWTVWPPGRLKRVFLHELAHIQRRDWLCKNALYVIRSVFWFLPPIWLLVKRADTYAEYACDDSVINTGVPRSDYATDLIELSGKKACLRSFVAIAVNELAIRINLILDGGRSREKTTWTYRLAFVAAGSCLIVPFYCVTLVPVLEKGSEKVSLPVGLMTRRVEPKPDRESLTLLVLPKEEYLTNLTLPRAHHGVLFDQYSAGNHVAETPLRKLDLALDQVISNDIIKFPSARYALAQDARVLPVYPNRALALGLEADVSVMFDIDIEGKARNIRFTNLTDRYLRFNESVLASLERSQFRVPVIDGEKVTYKDVKEVFAFKIDNQ